MNRKNGGGVEEVDGGGKEEQANLHLRPPVLEPELDLAGLQPQLPAQMHPLLLVRVGAFLKHPENRRAFLF